MIVSALGSCHEICLISSYCISLLVSLYGSFRSWRFCGLREDETAKFGLGVKELGI